MIKEDYVIKGVVEYLHPYIQSLIDRVTVLEATNNSVDQARLAAMMNDYEALRAQVKTLQYDVARLENQLEGKAEPSPWGVISVG